MFAPGLMLATVATGPNCKCSTSGASYGIASPFETGTQLEGETTAHAEATPKAGGTEAEGVGVLPGAGVGVLPGAGVGVLPGAGVGVLPGGSVGGCPGLAVPIGIGVCPVPVGGGVW